MKIKSKLIVLTAIFLMTFATWMVAYNYGLARAEPEIITHTENTISYVDKPVYIEVEKRVPVDRVVEVEKPVYIDREIEVPVPLQDWDSPEQLGAFLENDDTNRRVILTANADGKIEFNNQCEDFALQLRGRAMAIGRYLSVIALDSKEYEKWYGRPLKANEYHAICMARIGNGFWYIEPQTDKYWHALFLD